jgi:DNA repair exonuclease SbcCD nuclease subunit
MLYMAADIHLERRLRNRELFANDSFSAWLGFCRSVIEADDDEKAVILAGDVCDRASITGMGLHVLSRGLDMLAEEDIPVYEIAGNHDSGRPTVPETQGAINIDGKLKTLCGFQVYGLDYRAPDVLLKDLEKVPECDILVLHQAFQHLLGFEGATPLKWSDIPDRVGNVFCGDIHTTDVFEMSDDRYFVSPGSLHPTKVDEGGDHGYMTYDGSWKFHALPTRTILRASITTDEEMEELVKAVEEATAVEGAAMPVVESICLPKYEKRIMDIVGVFHINTVVPEEEEESSEASGKLNSTILDRLPDAVDREEDGEMFSFLYRLFTEDPGMVVDEKKKELIGE